MGWSERFTTRDFRDALGLFPSGVVVVTALEGKQPIGFSVNSFASLSLDPPLVSFCPSRASTTWPRIRNVGKLAVNILGEGSDHLCKRFSTKGVDRFAGVGWEPAPSGAPALEAGIAWLDCSIEAVHPGGDHEIVVARVEAVAVRDGSPRPVVFFGGAYHHLSD